MKSKKLELGLPEGITLDDIDSSDGSDDEKTGTRDVCSEKKTTLTNANDESCGCASESSSGHRNENEGDGIGNNVQVAHENREGKVRGDLQSRLKKNEELQKRASAVMERSRRKRVRELQKQVMSKISDEFPSSEDRDVLRSHDVKFGPPVDKSEGRKRKAAAAEETNKQSEGFRQEWQEVRRYIGVNDHLAGVDHGRLGPRSGLETKVEEAVASGNIQEAERLSDHLATRQFGQKIVEAIDAKRYLEDKKTEQMKPSKRKKLNWTFAEKQRWESKGNM